MKIIFYIAIGLICFLGITMFLFAPYILFKQFKYRKSENKQAELTNVYSNLKKYASWEMLVFSISMLGLGVYFFLETSNFIKSALPATGKIIELNHRSGKNAGDAPVVEFKDATGVLITFESDDYRPNGKYIVGNNIQVLYPLNKPIKAQINDFYSLWAGTIFDFSMVLIGLLGWFWLRKK